MIMKKILLLAVVMFASLNASAQFYAGGSIGFGSVKPVGGGDSESFSKSCPKSVTRLMTSGQPVPY